MDQDARTQATAMANAGMAAMLDFRFSHFITLSVIKVLYILGLALIVLTWLAMTVVSFTGGIVQGIGALVIGAIAAVLYMIFFRIWLELIVVVFRIGENTSKLVELRGGTPTQQGL